MPATHCSVAVHAESQPPQCSGSDARSTQEPVQLLDGDQQLPPPVHDPATQTMGPPHVVVAAPQWSCAVRRSTQSAPARVSPGRQTQAPATQVSALPQVCPAVPQLAGSTCVATHAPPLSTVPAGHEHRPPTHGTPLGHDVPQVPQFTGSVSVATQRPPQFVVPMTLQLQRPPRQVSPLVHR